MMRKIFGAVLNVLAPWWSSNDSLPLKSNSALRTRGPPCRYPLRWKRASDTALMFWIVVAVGTTIADRPPHRSVQARLRIRLLSWMSGGKAGIRIRMQNTGLRNPPVQERDETIPSHLGALTATD